MRRRWLILIAAVAALVILAGWGATRPASLSQDDLAGLTPDLDQGAVLFHTGGCASCHAPRGAEGEARLVLSGGTRLESPFGTFVAPNISSDPEHGIGDWSVAQIVTALALGSSPEGRHYYPAFPYGSYAKAELGDLVSLAAYLQTLPASDVPSQPHEIGFPFNIRAGIGLWKALYLSDAPVTPVGTDPVVERGRYLVEGLGHCAECHTPRDPLGGLDTARWMDGAANPSGPGGIPGISPQRLDWSAQDIVAYLETGFTPDFDVAGGSMRSVVVNMANLPLADLEAMAAYLKALPTP